MVHSQMDSLHGSLIHIPLHFRAVIKVTVAQEAISPSRCNINAENMQEENIVLDPCHSSCYTEFLPRTLMVADQKLCLPAVYSLLSDKEDRISLRHCR